MFFFNETKKMDAHEKMENPRLECLDLHLLKSLVTFLPGYDIARLTMVSHFWNSLLYQDEFVWSAASSQEFQRHSFPLLPGLLPIDAYRLQRSLSVCDAIGWRKLSESASLAARQGSSGDRLGPYFVVIGGWTSGWPTLQNDVHFFDTRAVEKKEERWNKIEPIGELLSPCYGHTVTQIQLSLNSTPFGSALIVLGGLVAGGYREETENAYLLLPLCSSPELISRVQRTPLFSILRGEDWNDGPFASVDWNAELQEISFVWKKFPSHREGMVPRAYHTSTFVSKNSIFEISSPMIIVFGGFAEMSALTHLRVFDLDSCQWGEPIVSGQMPCARFGHTATYVDGQIIILGGCDGGHNHKDEMTSGEELRDLHILDLKNDSWSWSQPRIDFDPLPITSIARCHSATLVGRNLIVFGGGPSFCLCNSAVLLDVDSFEWRVPRKIKGTIPIERQNHIAVKSYDSRSILIYGGYGGPHGMELASFFQLRLDESIRGQLHSIEYHDEQLGEAKFDTESQIFITEEEHPLFHVLLQLVQTGVPHGNFFRDFFAMNANQRDEDDQEEEELDDDDDDYYQEEEELDDDYDDQEEELDDDYEEDEDEEQDK